jgi:hypothetical protein
LSERVNLPKKVGGLTFPRKTLLKKGGSRVARFFMAQYTKEKYAKSSQHYQLAIKYTKGP